MRGRSSAELHALKCELAGEVLRASGRLRLRVTGWSMLPAIFPGDTLLIERANSESVGKGDIILFQRDRRMFVHRVSGKFGCDRDLQIVTQGDGMPNPDPPVSSSQLLGKVSFVVRDGRCLRARNESQSFPCAPSRLWCGVPLPLLVCLWEFTRWVRVHRSLFARVD
jgi:signal peptidase I